MTGFDIDALSGSAALTSGRLLPSRIGRLSSLAVVSFTGGALVGLCSAQLLLSSIGRLSSLAVVSFAGGALVGLCLLFLSETTSIVVWLYRALFLLIWLSAFMVPLVQGSNSVFRPTTQHLFKKKWAVV